MIATALSIAMAAAPTQTDKAKVVWDHYLSRRLDDLIEPPWIHFGYELVQKFVTGEKLQADQLELIDQIIASHSLKDGHEVPAFPGQPQSPMRIIHDGWKAGTPTWIFMGRSLTTASISNMGGGWWAVQRTIPVEFYQEMDQDAAPPTLWMAYKEDRQMGITALSSNVVGPAISFTQLWQAVALERAENLT